MNLKYLKYLLIQLLVILPACTMSAKSQYYFCRRLSVEDGLASNDIFSLIQDKRGFVWIGTGNGICRYDGSHLLTYTDFIGKDNAVHRIGGVGYLWLSPKKDKLMASTITFNTISYDFHHSKFVDVSTQNNKKDHLLVDRRRGIIRVAKLSGYTFNTDNVGHLYITMPGGKHKAMWLVKDLNQSSSRLNKYQIAKDRQGRFYIATFGNGLFVWNPKTDHITHITSGDSRHLITSNFLTCVMIDRNSDIWVGNDAAGISIIKRIPGMSVRYLYPHPEDEDENANSIGAVSSTGGNNLLVGMTNGDVFSCDPVGGTFTLIDKKPKKISTFFRDKDGRIWIGSLDGLYLGKKRVDTEKGVDLGAKWINDIDQDKYGRIWVAAYGGGLSVLWESNGKWYSKRFLKKGSNASMIRNMTMAEGRWLWFTSNYGLGCIDTWKKGIKDSDIKTFNAVNNRIASNQTHCITYSHSGLLYVGIAGKGLCVYKCKGEDIKLVKVYDTTNGLVTNNVRSVLEDNHGNIWVAQEEGIARINTKKDNSAAYHFSASVMGNIFYEKTACHNADGELFFGSHDGLLCIKSKPSDSQHGKVAVTDLLLGRLSVGDSLRLMSENKKEISLPYDTRDITFAFSDFDYAKASSSLFQYYLEGVDKDWNDGTTLTMANYSNLKPGHYVFHVRRSGDPASEGILEFTISQPWYNTWWAWLIYIAIATSIILMFLHGAHERLQLHQEMEVERKINNFRIDFFTQIAHEFRTPLAIMQNAVDKLNAEESAKPLRKTITAVTKGMVRLSRLINELMEFRKMSTGNRRLTVSKGDIVGEIKDVFTEFWPMADQKDIKMVFTPFAKKYDSWHDPKVIETVSYNLISNAMKYTPQHGNIMVTLSQDDSNLILSVADDGPAIPEDKRQHLFEPFMHGYASAGGMGIGLYIAKQMSNLHHGDLEYSSQDGKTVFTMTIPSDESCYANDEHGTTSTQTNNVTPQQPVGVIKSLSGEPINNLHIAVVEDDPDMMAQLKDELTQYFIIDTYMDGKSAVEGIRKHAPALVLCDIMLPEIDGYEVVRQLRADNDLKDIPIIMLTALEDEDHQIKGYKAGADDYMTKPCNYKVLLVRIAQLIKWRKDKKAELVEKETTDNAKETNEDSKGEVLISVVDKRMLDNVTNILVNHMADPNFTIDDLAQALHVGRTKLYGKVKDLTGLSPNKYLMKMRMEKAAQLLIESDLNIGEICFQVGIQEQSYFYRVFKSYYGVAPSSYRKQMH